MKYIRLVLGVIAGLFAITLVAEGIEFVIVKIVSGQSFEVLQANRDTYFAIRNRTGILIAKIGYSLLAGIAGGYVTTWISRKKADIAVYLLLFLQIASLVWAGFISELSETGPLWMWTYLLIVIPAGIWLGYRWKREYEARK